MSFSISVSGHVSPEDPKKDAAIQTAALALCAALDAAGVPYGGNVSTPTGGFALPAPNLTIKGGTIHVHPDGPGGTGTHN